MVKPIQKTPGQVLRDYRKEKGIAPEAFAKQLGIAESTLRSMENGTRDITAEWAVDFEGRTGGELTRHELRPDLFEVKAA